MKTLKTPEKCKKELLLGDYITVHVSALIGNQFQCAETSDIQVYREELFPRIRKEKGEAVKSHKKQPGKLIDVRTGFQLDSTGYQIAKTG